MYDILKMKNSWSRARALEFASHLVQTASPSLSEHDAADLVAREMRKVGFDKVVSDSAGNVVGILKGIQDGPTILLNSHLDTVSWKKETWSQDPLAGKVVDGRLYGVGAADCKGGVAAQVYVGDLLKRSLLPLRGNLIVAATVAEENGRSLGVRTLMEHTLPELDLKPDYAVLGEPTGLSLCYGHDGWVEVEINVRGANPFHLDDATRNIARDLRQDSLPGRAAWQTFEPQFHETSNGRVARIRADRRLTPSESVDELVHQLKHEAELVVNGNGSVAVEVAICQETQRMYTGKTTIVRQVVNAWTTDPFSPLVERARQALSADGTDIRPRHWELGRAGMGTAGGVLVREFNVPTICYGPGNELQAHAADEYVETERLAQAIYGTALVVHAMIGVPVFGWTSDEI